MAKLCLLGATGTIGDNTLAVIAQQPEQFTMVALTAHRNVDKMQRLCAQWSPRYAVMADDDAAEQLQQRLKHSDTRVLSGLGGLNYVATLAEVDTVMAAIVGAAGLLPTLMAAKAGKRILLANKEALVMSGQIFMQAVQENHATLLPIDSEHNAVFQAMGGQNQARDLKKIILTASGGPFRQKTKDELHHVTPEQACAHPNWVMGKKISVDSATLMNKGLEVIEACWLFNTDSDKIEVVIHPQSIIHSLVEYADGSFIAQLGQPDMRVPIAYSLNWPKRLNSGVKSLNLTQMNALTFEAVNRQNFPCLDLAYAAFKQGGTACTVLNAANEIAVAAFLNRQIKFMQIPHVIEQTLSRMDNQPALNLQAILAADTQARTTATALI
jgi:1-deoxy-D-xylulose-5-phosphate reductoisomerase